MGEDSDVAHKERLCGSARLALALEGMFGFAIFNLTRYNLSLAIVCMTNFGVKEEKTSFDVNNTSYHDQLSSDDNLIYNQQQSLVPGNLTTVSANGEFYWDKELRGFMLSSFFWGYFITQLPGGALANRFGGKHVLGTGMQISTIANILIPPAARIHPYLVIILRFIMGLGHGVVYPSMHGLWGRWAPPLERCKLLSITYAGAIVGTIGAMISSSYICDINLDNGWPFVFYIHGFLGLIWWVLWLFLSYNSPEEHPRISIEEKTFIETSIGPSAYEKKFAIPWKSIFTSRPVWAIIIAHSCDNWGTYTILTCIPTYMKEVLQFDIKANGALSALPYIGMYIAAIFAGHLADFIRSRKILGTTAVRKLFQTAAFLIPSVFITAVGFVSCEKRYIAVIFLTISVTFTAFGRCAYLINHVDLAPRFSAILFAITNTSATIPGMIAPYIASSLTGSGTREEWQRVFFICGGVYAIGWIFYSIFASGNEQKWATISTDCDNNGVILNEKLLCIKESDAKNKKESHVS